MRRLTPVGSGIVRGRMHRFAGYPALRLDASGEEIAGEVFEVLPDAWPALDAYEGCIPKDPGHGLFLRERVAVEMHDGLQRECWVYTYARELP